jgi:hypothetical protein
MSLSVIAGCFFVDRGFSYFLCWLPAFGFETLLVIIMLYKGLSSRDRLLNSPLLNVIVRDRFVFKHGRFRYSHLTNQNSIIYFLV